MIKLEQQVLMQSKDLERMQKQVEDLRAQNQELSDRLLELRSNFENQKQSIGTIERVGWATATGIAVLIGKYMFGIG
jgi:peptidoglycan hydrolase CwlO-like protein